MPKAINTITGQAPNRRSIKLLGCLSVLIGLCALSQPVSAVECLKTPHELNKSMGYYEDTNSSETISSIRQRPFKPAEGLLNFRLQPGPLWVRFSLSLKANQSCFLNVGNATLEWVELFGQDTQGHWTLLKTAGAKQVQTADTLRTNAHVFEIQRQPSSPSNTSTQSAEQVYYLRVRTPTVMMLPLTLADATGHAQLLIDKHLQEATYFGIFMALLLYNLFLFYSLRDRAYLFYSLYLAFVTLYLLFYLNGYYLFLPEGLRALTHRFAFTLAGISVIWGILFCHTFLKASEFAPRFSRLAWGLFGLIGLATCFDLLSWRTQGAQTIQVLGLLGPIYMLILGILVYRRGYQAARFYLLAWGQYILAMEVYVWMLNSPLPAYNTLRSVLPMSSALEMLLLSFALAHRVQILQKEKQALQLKHMNLIKEQKTALETQVKLRTNELETALTKVQQLNQIKDQLFSVLAHDLRTPFIALKGALMLSDRQTLSPEIAVEMINSAKASINSVYALLENLLAWARSQMQGEDAVMPERLELLSQVLELNDVFGLLAKQKEIELRVEIPADLHVIADPNHLQLILRNLISNALKFTPRGGMIILRARHQQTEIQIEIEDTGIGMSPEQVAQLFKPNLASQPGTEQESGSGLGLYLVQSYVEANQGQLTVSSIKDSGTLFKLNLPKA